MRILVTGGLGFIGRRVVLAALHGMHEVRLLDRTPALPSDSPVEVIEASVTEPDAVDYALEGVDVVCHQAAKVGLGVDLQDMPDYVADNDYGTAVLLAGMTRADVGRLVLASSMVIYGEGHYECDEHGRQPAPPRSTSALEAGRFEPTCPHCEAPLTPGLVDEDAAFDPRNAYAASKIAQEYLASIWADQSGGRAIALRYHNVYGPGMPRATPYSGVAAMFRSSLERGESPRVYEDGAQMRDFVHVADVARANVLALRSVVAQPSGQFAAYNVCSGSPISIREVAELVATGTGTGREIAPEVTGGYRLGDVRHIVASPE
ncbi:MAG: NAD-dependent epimerase/dehydratase family protein, partial [Actinomycetia bacterium]|nr:NAD-dependent epimerase/dehydratase family protein [Actinomycetes bacterium]